MQYRFYCRDIFHHKLAVEFIATSVVFALKGSFENRFKWNMNEITQPYSWIYIYIYLIDLALYNSHILNHSPLWDVAVILNV